MNNGQQKLITDFEVLDRLIISAMSIDECDEVEEYISNNRQRILFIQRSNNCNGTVIRLEDRARDVFDQIRCATKQLRLKLEPTKMFKDFVGVDIGHRIVIDAPVFNCNCIALLRFLSIRPGKEQRSHVNRGCGDRSERGDPGPRTIEIINRNATRGIFNQDNDPQTFRCQLDRALPRLFPYPSNIINVSNY